MQAPLQQTFDRQNPHGLAHGIAGDAKGIGQGHFLQKSAWAQFSIQDSLPQNGGCLVGNANPVDLGTLHDESQQKV
jgi:hypothetical protein